jgi:hypothetical protein
MQSGINFRALPNSVTSAPSIDPCCAILSRFPVMMSLPDGQITTRPSKPLSSPRRKNISLFQKCKSGVGRAVSCPQEGRIAIVTDVGCGMRWTRRCARRAQPDADGQVAWSRSPDAGINPRVGDVGPIGPDAPRVRGDGGYQARHTGESAKQPLTPLRGECRRVSANLR